MKNARPVRRGVSKWAMGAAAAMFIIQWPLVYAFNQYMAEVSAHRASRLADAERFAEGELEARKAIEYNRYNGYALFQGGTAAYRRRDFNTARDLLSRSLNIMPHMANNLRILGLSSYFLKDYEQAAVLLDRYLKLVPQPSITPEFVLRMTALAFFSSGQLGKANYYLIMSSDSGTTPGEVFRVRTVSHLLANLPASAEFAYRNFRAQMPEGVLDPLEIVNNAIEAGKLEETRQFLEVLYAEYPDDTSLVKALAATYNRLKRLPDAQELLRQAVGRNPEDGELQLIYGDVLYAGRKYSQAFAAYDAHLRLAPQSPFRQEILRKKATTRQ